MPGPRAVSLIHSSISVAQGNSPRSRSRSNMTANLGTKKMISTETTSVPAVPSRIG